MVYYDVCEDPEELQSMVHTGVQQANSPAVTQLKRRLQTLETKRGNICARRAYLRNKKVWASTTDIHLCSEDILSPIKNYFTGILVLSKGKCIDLWVVDWK